MTYREVLTMLSNLQLDAEGDNERIALGVAYNAVCEVMDSAGISDDEEARP